VTVVVCLFATLSRYLPPGSSRDRVALQVPDHTSVGQVVARLGIPADLETLRVVNGHDAELDQVLQDGDVLSIFPPLAGGA
jgi:molybdopterin converting factor small subunit